MTTTTQRTNTTIEMALPTSMTPFPAVVCAYFIAGFGLSLQVRMLRFILSAIDNNKQGAQGNGFVGSLHNDMATKMGFFQASYGMLSVLGFTDASFPKEHHTLSKRSHMMPDRTSPTREATSARDATNSINSTSWLHSMVALP